MGGELARRARGLGMNVIAYDPYASEERAAAVGVKLVSFNEALETADFFSLHMPLTPNTKHIFNDEAFAKVWVRSFDCCGRLALENDIYGGNYGGFVHLGSGWQVEKGACVIKAAHRD